MRSLLRLGRRYSYQKLLDESLVKSDPELRDIIKCEEERQKLGINLIPSENHSSRAVFEALGSVMSCKYSEGYPGSRYYGGVEFCDKVQILCQTRALKVFKLRPEEWGVNVQALSGSPANFAVYSGVLNPFDRIMSLDLPHGGHLSHGYQTPDKKISSVSKFFEVLHYRVNQNTGIIDYDKLCQTALLYRPKLIVAGASSYSRLIDYKKFRQICDQVNALLLCDIAHISGLTAGGVIPSAFEFADIVTTTTHKGLRGPRGALIFYRLSKKKNHKGELIDLNLKERIDFSVFPGQQGGPHNHTIAAIAAALGQATRDQFREYQQQVLQNSKYLCAKMQQKGYNIVSGGTDNHLFMIDLRSKNIDGARVQSLLDKVRIYVNKNTIPGDKSALVPKGVRIGTPALTTRGLTGRDFDTVAQLLDRGVQLTIQLNKSAKVSKLADFKKMLKEVESKEVKELNEQVAAFMCKFPLPNVN